MPTLLKFVAQQAEDLYNQSFRTDTTTFFLLEDFIFYVGNTISQMYDALYQRQYNENRADKKDELVSFDSTVLSEQILEVENKDGRLFAKYKQPVMSFAYDNNTIGVQDIYPIKPQGNYQFERTTSSGMWQLEYVPYVDKIFFYGNSEGIVFKIKGACNIKTIAVHYVPSMYPEAIIPDGMIQPAILATVMAMKQVAAGVISKETLDGNYNKIIQTELNKTALTA